MVIPKRPVIYEINTAVFLNELSERYDRNITFANVPTEVWDSFSILPIDAVWFMGVWQRSPMGANIALQDKNEYQQALPGLQDTDVIGSAYCILNYVVDKRWGGTEGLATARQNLAARGMGMILDFVPNHTALDHPWIKTNPDYFIQGGRKDLKNDPGAFYDTGRTVVARGKDPNFSPWTDVAQLNAFSERYRDASVDILNNISQQCDGVRCDMAMLMLNDVFARTWGSRAGAIPSTEYWEVLIGAMRRTSPDFVFIAEAYWGLQNALFERDFDYCYDKTFYDLLRKDKVRSLIRHLRQPHQEKMVRFIENHDEERAADIFHPDQLQAAAVLLSTTEGAKLYLQGQFSGYKTRIPVQLARGPLENSNPELEDFYRRLMEAVQVLKSQSAQWKLLHTEAMHLGLHLNRVISWLWEGKKRFVVIVNYGSHGSNVKIALEALGPEMTMKPVLQSEGGVDIRPIEGEGISVRIEAWAYTIIQI